MPKDLIDKRLAQLAAEGTELRAGVDIGGEGGLDPVELRAGVDAVVLATGALQPRDLEVPGRALAGVHQAMDYLPLANRVRTGDLSAPPIDAAGKQVVIIGGGDTAADCLGTANRQGAVSVTQLDHNPRPPETRDVTANPWPQWPKIHRTSAAHEEGVVESWAREAVELVGDEAGHICAVVVEEVQIVRVDGRREFRTVPESRAEIPCDLLLIAAGFVGTERGSLLDRLGVEVDPGARLDAGRRRVGDHRRRRLLLRRRHARCEPGRLGDRRGPGLRRRGRRGAQRTDGASGAGPARRPAALTRPSGETGSPAGPRRPDCARRWARTSGRQSRYPLP